jgi:hypothetical protein
VNRRRCPFPTSPSSLRNLCALSISALRASDLFPPSSSLAPLPVDCLLLSPIPATLTGHSQRIENAITLSPVFVTLTGAVSHKSFACHSCRKQRGVGYTAQSKFLSCPPAFPNFSVIRTSAKLTCNPFGFRTSKSQGLKCFGFRTYEKNGVGGRSSGWRVSVRLSELCVSALSFLFLRRPSHATDYNLSASLAARLLAERFSSTARIP